MTELNLSETTYARPACCVGCKHFGNQNLESVYCPTNVAIGTLGRIKRVVEGDFELDSVEDAGNLLNQLQKLSKTAAECGKLLAEGTIEKPYTVTTDLSLTNFTVHSPVQLIPARVV